MMMMRSRYVIGTLRSQCTSRCRNLAVPTSNMYLSTHSAEPKAEQVVVTHERASTGAATATSSSKGMLSIFFCAASTPFIVLLTLFSAIDLDAPSTEDEAVLTEACGEVDDTDMEQEEMFVDAPDFFDFKVREWNGPRRGGRMPEPTRFGDWERKGRCTDF
jgi:hypothetical protein